ncbi:hypothetical protein M3Y99_00830000 [Aphelenchoides fujianensis]|nr:hypothetical protein M3Y99_00830000 [Aphelenchoides fujianensis]
MIAPAAFRFSLSLLLFAVALAEEPAPPEFAAARVGRPLRLAADGPALIVERCTRRSERRQFAFRLPGWSGWTTDGTDRIGANGTRFLPDGSLQIDAFGRDDHGVYAWPQRVGRAAAAHCEPSVFREVRVLERALERLERAGAPDGRLAVRRGRFNPPTGRFGADEVVREVPLGADLRVDFGAAALVVQRETDDTPAVQLTFALAAHAGGWTVDGTTFFDADRTRLWPNGTLEIRAFRRADVGRYARPLDPARPLRPPAYVLLELPGFLPPDEKPTTRKHKSKHGHKDKKEQKS